MRPMLPSALVAGFFFGGLMDDQAMPRTRRTPITLSSDSITLEELACAKGHVYPLLLVRLALTSGLRGSYQLSRHRH